MAPSAAAIGLPNASLAEVDERKITDYLLAANHPAGRGKALFFSRFGFGVAQWQELRAALLAHSRASRVITVADSEFGRRYVLEGRLATPSGRRPQVRSVWFVATGETIPRLATAYPVSGVRR